MTCPFCKQPMRDPIPNATAPAEKVYLCETHGYATKQGVLIGWNQFELEVRVEEDDAR